MCVLQAIIFLGCLTGFVAQTYFISYRFFIEATATRNTISFPVEFEVPAFTFCIPIADILTFDGPFDPDCYAIIMLDQAEMKKKKPECNRKLKELGLMDSVLINGTWSFFDLFSYEYLNPTNPMESLKVDILNGFEADENVTKEFVRYDRFKCFKLDLAASPNFQSYDKFALKFNEYATHFLSVNIDLNVAWGDAANVFLYVHSTKTIPRHSVQRLVLQLGNDYTMTYTKVSVAYDLEHRFVKHCIDYTKVYGAESRDDQIEKCFEGFKENETSSAFKNCSKKYELPDCHSERYVPKMLKNERIDETKITVRFVVPEDEVQQVHYQKISLDEYLVYIGSCFGIWFGFSFFALISTSYVWLRRKAVSMIKH